MGSEMCIRDSRQVRLDARTNARLDAYAAATGTSASQIIRDALADYLPA